MTGKDPGSRHVVLSGCSGGGKSTLLRELGRRGFATVPEPGRRIVEEELGGGGKALPWVDLAAFARRAIAVASQDRLRASREAGWVFFDRGLIDAAVALERATSRPLSEILGGHERYHSEVFLTPPWPAIYASDGERRHGLDEAIDEYDRLLRAFDALGYGMTILPKVGVDERADIVLDRLGR